MMEKQSELYRSITKGSKVGIVETNDCVVRSFSLAANRPYDEVHALCKLHGRKDRKGTYQETTERVALALGFRTVVERKYRRATKYGTLAQFLRDNPKGRYFLIRNGHAFAVIDGVVHDWERGTGPRSRVVYAAKLGS